MYLSNPAELFEPSTPFNTSILFEKYQKYQKFGENKIYSTIKSIEEGLTKLKKEYESQELVDEFEDKYSRLPQKIIGATYNMAGTTNNAIYNKNRYGNVLAHDKCLTTLMDGYINANYIGGNYYIGQGPMDGCLEDFWSCIWKYNIRKIVCLTPQKEGEKIKYDQYFSPLLQNHFSYGEFRVGTFNEIKESDTIVRRKLVLTHKDSIKVIDHIDYVGWWDYGIPKDCSDFLNIISMVDENTPTFIHCSAGVGRTGTFCVTHFILTILTKMFMHGVPFDGSIFDILSVIKFMRMQRILLVQTVDQMHFCKKVVVERMKVIMTTVATTTIAVAPITNPLKRSSDILDMPPKKRFLSTSHNNLRRSSDAISQEISSNKRSLSTSQTNIS